MAQPTFLPQPFDVSPIERGLARGQRKEERAQDIARQESIREEQRAERQVQHGFQALGVQQRQQGIDIQQQQFAAANQKGVQERLFREQQADDEKEFRESQARLDNNIAIYSALPKSIPSDIKLGFFQKIVDDLDMDDNPLSGVDLSKIDLDEAGTEVASVWDQFKKGKLSKPQLEIAMQAVFAKNAQSAAAKQGAAAASAIARGGEATDRTTIAAGVDARKIPQYTGIINNINTRLNEKNEETGLPFLAIGSEGRRKQQLRLEAYEDLRDKASGIDIPSRAPSPPPAPAQPAPIAQPTLEEFMVKARVANPDKSDKELTEFYTNKYGTTLGQDIKGFIKEIISIPEGERAFEKDLSAEEKKIVGARKSFEEFRGEKIAQLIDEGFDVLSNITKVEASIKEQYEAFNKGNK